MMIELGMLSSFGWSEVFSSGSERWKGLRSRRLKKKDGEEEKWYMAVDCFLK
jgi:hypothetical protein